MYCIGAAVVTAAFLVGVFTTAAIGVGDDVTAVGIVLVDVVSALVG